MLIIFSLLLLFSVGRSVDGLRFETKTIGVGDALTLTCPRQNPESYRYLFWMRFISGSLPEVLGGTYAIDYEDHKSVNNNSHFTTKKEQNDFVLQIHRTQLSDTGFYYCITVKQRHMTFIKQIFLTIKDASGTDQNITTVLQVPPSESARSVTVQCSVPSGSENRTCSGEHSLYWFKVGPKETLPRLVYTHENSEDECELSPEQPASEECVYNLSTIIHSADAGTYSCAVVTCGEMMFGNVTRLDQQALSVKMITTGHFLLFAALAASLMVNVFLIYINKKATCGCFHAALVDEANAAAATADPQRQQRDEDSVNYSALTFSKRKAHRAKRRNPKEGETIYADVVRQ